MRRLTLSNEKGGVGKTALAVNLARHAARNGKRVLFVDLDVQANGTDAFGDDCPRPFSTFDLLSRKIKADRVTKAFGDEPVKIAVAAATPELADLKQGRLEAYVSKFEENMKELEGLFDLAVIDTPPTLGVMLAISLLISRSVLIPIEVETSSLNGTLNVVNTITHLKAANPGLEIIGIVANKLQNKPRQLENLKEIREHPVFGKFLLPRAVSSRDAVAQALSDRVELNAIRKTASRKAVHEMRELGKLILNKLFGEEK